jgi:hypothetical protein
MSELDEKALEELMLAVKQPGRFRLDDERRIRSLCAYLAASPAPARDDVLEEAAKKADRIADIIKRNLYHQHEKVEDARMFALQLAGDLRSLKGGKS